METLMPDTFSVSFSADALAKSGTSIVPVFKGGKAFGAAQELTKSESYKAAAKAAGFKGEKGSNFTLYAQDGNEMIALVLRLARVFQGIVLILIVRNFHGPICDGTVLARDLVNEPPNVIYPKAYADRIRPFKRSFLATSSPPCQAKL